MPRESFFRVPRLGPPLSLALGLVLVVSAGCALQQTPESPPAAPETSPLRPLPFKGRLVSGKPNQLPRLVAMSLSNDSPVTFSYREELTHEEHHTSTLLSALQNLTFASYPTGEYVVTAFASLSISNGGQPIGDYTAQTRITRPYGVYSQPTHKELDEAARAAVRQEIDRKLEAEMPRLAASTGETE